MSDRTQHVIDAIDGALEDWSVGPDAMRWTPESERPAPRLILRGPVVLHTAAAGTQPADVAAWRPVIVDDQRVRQLCEQVGEALRPIMGSVERAAEAMGMSVREFADHLARMLHMDQLASSRPAEPEGPKARALRLRQQRGTGPERTPASCQKRPRRLP